MIDASTCDLRDPTDRNRKDSITSIVSGIIMNEQYSRQMALQQQQVNTLYSESVIHEKFCECILNSTYGFSKKKKLVFWKVLISWF